MEHDRSQAGELLQQLRTGTQCDFVMSISVLGGSSAFLATHARSYAQVLEAFVSYDRVTGRPRGFGFVIFEDPAVADRVASQQHTIDRREVKP